MLAINSDDPAVGVPSTSLEIATSFTTTTFHDPAVGVPSTSLKTATSSTKSSVNLTSNTTVYNNKTNITGTVTTTTKGAVTTSKNRESETTENVKLAMTSTTNTPISLDIGPGSILEEYIDQYKNETSLPNNETNASDELPKAGQGQVIIFHNDKYIAVADYSVIAISRLENGAYIINSFAHSLSTLNLIALFTLFVALRNLV